MAKINTVFGFVDNITNPLKRMNSALKDTEGSFNKIQAAIITANSAMALFSMAKGGVDRIANSIYGLVSAYDAQINAESRLGTVMSARMNSSEKDIEKMNRYIKEFSDSSMYGRTMLTNAAQELATYVTSANTLKNLLPLLTNIAAQSNVTTEQGLMSFATMIGKVMGGDMGGLSKRGWVFTDEEKSAFKLMNEEQRLAFLVENAKNAIGEQDKALSSLFANMKKQKELDNLKITLGGILKNLSDAGNLLKLTFKVDVLTKFKSILETITPIFTAIVNGIYKVYEAIKTAINFVNSKIRGAINAIIENLNSLAVALGIIGAVFVTFSAIWIAAHTKMLAVTIATNAKTLASWIIMDAKLVATHTVAMTKMAVQWVKGLGPVGWIIIGIIALVVALIVICVKMGATFEKVGRAIGKVFGAIYAGGYNAIMGLINLFIKLQNLIADSFIGQTLGMQKMEMREYKNIKETMEAGAEKGGQIGKSMDDWIKGVKNRFNPKEIAEGIQEGLPFTGGGELSVSDKNLVEVAEDYKKLLTKRAIQRFNLQYKTVTPEINIQKVDVHKEADAGKSLSLLSDMLGEYADSNLRAVG